MHFQLIISSCNKGHCIICCPFVKVLGSYRRIIDTDRGYEFYRDLICDISRNLVFTAVHLEEVSIICIIRSVIYIYKFV